MALYFISILAIITISVFAITYSYRNKMMFESIKSVYSKTKASSFRWFSLGVQFVIALALMSSITIFIRQIYHLNHCNVGFNKDNIGSISSSINIDNISEVEATAKGSLFLVSFGYSQWMMSTDKNMDKENSFAINAYDASPQMLSLFNFSLADGRFYTENPDEIVINEKAAKMMSVNLRDNYIIYTSIGQFKVTGIIKDFCLESPLLETRPLFFRNINDNSYVTQYFKFNHKKKKDIRDTIIEKFQRCPSFLEDGYKDKFKSDIML